MKTLKWMTLAAVAAIAMPLVSCSDDEPNVNTDNDASYMAVRLVPAGSFGSRAGVAGDFEVGDAAENKADKALFLVFDKDGNQVQRPASVGLTWETSTTKPGDNVNIEKKSNAVVTIAGTTTPTQALVILNAPEGADTDLAGKTLTAVREKVGAYGAATEGSFIITNSSYEDASGNIVYATSLTDGSLYKTPEDAEKAEKGCTTFYVERVVAKIRTKHSTENSTAIKNPGSTINIDATPVKLTPYIDGITIANAASTSYLFKNIEDNGDWFTNWNDPGNYRSYWANSPETPGFSNETWNEIQSSTETAEANIFDKKFYVQENTTATKTSVLITATLCGTDGKPVTFVRWAGNYYTKDAFLNEYVNILNRNGYKVKVSETDTRAVTAADLVWISAADKKKAPYNALEAYESTVKAAQGVTLIYTGENDKQPLADAFLCQKENRVWLWEGGKCYYYAPIEHFGAQIGVVRNHIYDLELNSIEGLGTPVVDPDEPIDPEKPVDELFYLSAKINILSWKLVTNTVDFN